VGEAERKESATQRFISDYPDCCFCGGLRCATTREHMPPKSLFDGSHRPDKLVMPACDECNKGTSTADLVVSLVSRWSHETSVQAQLDHARLAVRIRKQAPQVVAEWFSLQHDERQGAILHLSNHGVRVPHDAELAAVGPHVRRQRF
jgi:hypothetical protein